MLLLLAHLAWLHVIIPLVAVVWWLFIGYPNLYPF